MYQVLFYIALFIGFIPLIILLIQKRAFTKKPIIPFIWLIAFASLYEFIGTVLLKINTAYWFQIYSLLEFLAIYYFFLQLFKGKYKTLFRILFVLFVISYSLSFSVWSNKSSLLPLVINQTFISAFVFIFSFRWFADLFKNLEIQNPWLDSTFYFVSGFSIYYSSTLFLFLLSSFIFNSNAYFYDYWLVNVIATLILRVFLILGVWKQN